MNLEGLEMIAVLVVLVLFVKVLEQFGLFEPVSLEVPVFQQQNSYVDHTRRETEAGADLTDILPCEFQGKAC
ncbi:hypothetical protein Nmel_010335 [Mimus melanotis]